MEDDMITHDKREKFTKGWTVDKTVSPSNILTILAFAAAGAVSLIALADRVTVVEQDVLKHEAVTALEFRGVHAQLAADRQRDITLKIEIGHKLDRIEDGIYRHIETTARYRQDKKKQ